MKQEIIDSIREEYEDITKMVKTEFREAKDESITLARYNKLRRLEELHWHSETSGIDSSEFALEEAIASNFSVSDTGGTNGILMYISELGYDTYKRLFPEEMEGKDPSSMYTLYMDLEDETKYFVKSSDKEEFEKTHQVIVTYKNPEVNAGWNFERNYYGLQFIRRNFIRKAMYSTQEEAAKQFVKKYPVTDKITESY